MIISRTRRNVTPMRRGVAVGRAVIAIALASCVVAALLVARELFFRTAWIRAIKPDEETVERSMAFGPLCRPRELESERPKATAEPERVTLRPIFAVEGQLPSSMGVRGDLYLVRHGAVESGGGVTAGTSSAQIGAVLPPHICLRFLVCQRPIATERQVAIGVIGHTSAGGSGHPLTTAIDVSKRRLVSGSLRKGNPRVVYAEGDKEPEISPGMSIEEFARKNDGNYVVVTLELKEW